MANIITMPKLGLTMTEGTVSKWYKNEGDEVKAGDVVFEVTTDKLTNEVTSDYDGVLIKKLCEEGGEIPCKEGVAVIGEAGETYSSAPAAVEAAAPSTAAPAAVSGESVGGVVTDGNVITMPKLGLTMTEGIVSKWYKKEGDEVKAGDVVFEVTTDKLTNEVVSDYDGLLIKQLCEEGGEIPCKDAVAIIGPAGTTYTIAGAAASVASAPSQPATATVSVAVSKPAASVGGYVLASPAAKKLAKEKGISLNDVPATGPNGRVVLKDVENFASASGVKTSPMAAKLAAEMGVDVSKLDVNGRIMKADVIGATAASSAAAVVKEDKVVKLTGMRKTISKRMSESWHTSPRVTYNTSIDTTAMKELKNKLAPKLKEKGIKLTFNHILMKVVAKVLIEMPYVNSSLNGDELTLHSSAHIGLAVALDNGLIVPNVKNCDTKSISEIAVETEQKIDAAKSNKLNMDDMMGATFTISNLGMFGITSFSPIINQPEMAILGVCAIVDTPVVVDGQITVRPLMNLSLTADHRAVDGALAAKFLQRIKELLENPYLMLI